MGESRVVVGVDGSPASLRALWTAVAEARRRDAPLVVVNAPTVLGRSTPALSAGLGPANAVVGGALSPDEVQHGHLVIDDAFVELYGGHPGDITIRVVISQLTPGSGLVNAVGPEDVLVVGRSRNGILRRLFTASVSNLCVAAAPCPVLVVPGPDAPKRSYSAGHFRRRVQKSG